MGWGKCKFMMMSNDDAKNQQLSSSLPWMDEDVIGVVSIGEKLAKMN